MSRDLGRHARDAVAVELDRAECLGRGLVEFAGQLECQPCSAEAAYSWWQTGLDRLMVNTVVMQRLRDQRHRHFERMVECDIGKSPGQSSHGVAVSRVDVGIDELAGVEPQI